MRAIVTVVGKDRVGIIAETCSILSENNVNILDISQTILQDYFTMMMLVDTAQMKLSFAQLADTLEASGQEKSLSIRIQREDIFNAMHRI